MDSNLFRNTSILISISPLTLVFLLSNTTNTSSILWLYASIQTCLWLIILIFLFTKNNKCIVNNIDIAVLGVYFWVVCLAIIRFKSTKIILCTGLMGFLYYSWRYMFCNRNSRAIELFAIVFIAIGLIESIFGFAQLYGILPNSNIYFKITGHFLNPDHFAGFIVSSTPFAVGIFVYRKSIKNKILVNVSGCYILLSLIILPATQIRGSWLALLTGFLFLMFYKHNEKNLLSLYLNGIFKKLLFAVILVSVLAASSIMLHNLKPDSVFGRLLIWKVTSQMIAEKPILGYGANQFHIKYNLTQAEYFNKGHVTEKEQLIAGNVEHAHNEYLQIWMEYGLIGLVLFLLIINSVFYPSKRFCTANKKLLSKEAIEVSSKASIIAVLVSSLFSFPLQIIPTLVNFTFLLALVSSLKNKNAVFEFKDSLYWFRFRVFFVVMVLGTISY